ncbi:hypothetical protein HPB47_024981 [Ixodes persulcatus]|uniref:Uncharacterized protein n=1 Tax=Ixodes persulcatus TaxID=34615 RepID=A0AC60Q542_IXOPE|nr:hypothetical protein HPB47_024981 [Ixodes persulcatus]
MRVDGGLAGEDEDRKLRNAAKLKSVVIPMPSQEPLNVKTGEALAPHGMADLAEIFEESTREKSGRGTETPARAYGTLLPCLLRRKTGRPSLERFPFPPREGERRAGDASNQQFLYIGPFLTLAELIQEQ